MIDPGRLKTRLAIQAPAETPDGQGGTLRDYTTIATAWAAVTPVASRAAESGTLEAGAEGALTRLRITLRGNYALTLQHRLVDGDRVYRIVGLRDRDDRRFVEIDAELRVE